MGLRNEPLGSRNRQRRDWRQLVAALFLGALLLLTACGQPAVAPTPTVHGLATVTPPPTTAPTTAPTVTSTAIPTATVASATATLAQSGAPATSATLAPTPTIAPTIPPTIPPAPTATPLPRVGQPVRLKIPLIKVDAAIEYVGLTPDGAMDTPKDYSDTAWYQLGPRPGEPGNAAIAGHVDSKTGKAVFWDLQQLKPGDEIVVVGDDGVERKFVVTANETYKRDEAPLARIFGPAAGAHLNLITCDQHSTFDRQKGQYASTRVVYTDAAP